AAARVAAQRQNTSQLAGAGIVGHREPASHLNHGSCPSSLSSTSDGPRAARYDFGEAPALQLGKRPGLHDSHRVARLGLALFVMRVKFLGYPDDAPVQLVLRQAR